MKDAGTGSFVCPNDRQLQLRAKYCNNKNDEELHLRLDWIPVGHSIPLVLRHVLPFLRSIEWTVQHHRTINPPCVMKNSNGSRKYSNVLNGSTSWNRNVSGKAHRLLITSIRVPSSSRLGNLSIDWKIWRNMPRAMDRHNVCSAPMDSGCSVPRLCLVSIATKWETTIETPRSAFFSSLSSPCVISVRLKLCSINKWFPYVKYAVKTVKYDCGGDVRITRRVFTVALF